MESIILEDEALKFIPTPQELLNLPMFMDKLEGLVTPLEKQARYFYFQLGEDVVGRFKVTSVR